MRLLLRRARIMALAPIMRAFGGLSSIGARPAQGNRVKKQVTNV